MITTYLIQVDYINIYEEWASQLDLRSHNQWRGSYYERHWPVDQEQLRVQCLAQGCSDMLSGKLTVNLEISGRPALPPEPQLPEHNHVNYRPDLENSTKQSRLKGH